MGPIVLFEDSSFPTLLPLLYWRSVFELRCGRKLLMDRVAQRFQRPIDGMWTRDWIADVVAERFQYRVNTAIEPETVLVNGRWLINDTPSIRTPPFVGRIDGEVAYIACDDGLARRLSAAAMLDHDALADAIDGVAHDEISGCMIRYAWDLVSRNAAMLESDWTGSDRGNEGQVDHLVVMRNPDQIHIGRGACVEAPAVLDARDGPIFIAENATVRGTAHICGPAYVGPGSVINPQAYIHGGTTIGSVCKIGGEIDTTIFAGYSNKQHTGFLGHAYLGSWINLGASTVNSDLKNTYGTVRAWVNGEPVDTGGQFFGAVIADHVKAGIGTRIPTGGSIGFAANLVTSRTLPHHVPSFTWLTDAGPDRGDAARLAETARIMMARRRVDMTPAEQTLFRNLPDIATRYERPIDTSVVQQ